MLNENDRAEAVRRFTSAIGTVAKELLDAGAQHEPLAAAMRIQANVVEMAGPRAPMTAGEQELADLARKAHEFINTLQVAGIEEHVAVTVIANTAIERVARTRGAAGAAHWLRALANLVDKNGDAIETTAKSH